MVLTRDASGEVSYTRQSYDHILKHILSGNLKPGDEVNRKELAQELGISISPVSDAISQLVTEGFLETLPRRQTRIRLVTKEEVRGLLILREAIECQAARLYSGDRILQEKDKLVELAKAVDSTEAGSRANELAESAFHQALVDLLECELMSQEFTRIMRRKLFMKINVVVPWNVQPPMDSHIRLVNDLCEASPEQAEALMRNHLERGRERILR